MSPEKFATDAMKSNAPLILIGPFGASVAIDITMIKCPGNRFAVPAKKKGFL